MRFTSRFELRASNFGLVPAALLLLVSGLLHSVCAAETNRAVLPPEVRAVWDMDQAHRESTPSRERICLNGLWRWQPANAPGEVPRENWGYFKVPGSWPGITDYMQKDSQRVFAHASWSNRRLADVSAAWYERELAVPTQWAGRRITLSLAHLNSLAEVYVDGSKAGDVRFPGGELDLTGVCRPGEKHRVSLLVMAMPLRAVMLSYVDSASAREVKGAVARRGLCGDVFLVSTPASARIADLKVNTSVRNGEIEVEAGLEDLAEEKQYRLGARISKRGSPVHQFTSRLFRAGEVTGRFGSMREGATEPGKGRFTLRDKWCPSELWDIHTPDNTLELQLSLLDAAGQTLDTLPPERFGYREFRIDGRDFYLNGSRIFLSAVPLDNAQVGAALAYYEGAKESLKRLKNFGINFVYTHNYDCLPGSHLGFEEILRAADDVGMLVSFTQPHFSHYEWQSPQADLTNGYLRHADYYVRAARNHPSVVAYSMSHNATGYNEDMNPDMIDGIQDRRDTWASRNVKSALRAEEIVRSLDASRIVYHHASGNLGSMHPINFYPNFVPVQELSDWFGHWGTNGVKPVFLCEYGAPFTWDWTMYRGWYKGKREFGSAVVPWEFCLAEWNSQFLGDEAFRVSEAEKANLRWEARQFRDGKLWHRWDYPNQVGSSRFDERYPVFAKYITDNWRAFRTWGVSAISPWEHGHYWKLRQGVNSRREDLKVDWENLQRPGFSPDCIDQRYERIDLAFGESDWVPTAAAEALLRNNRPLLAYIAGKPAAFTSKDHLFVPGETVEKQVILINNSREPVTGVCEWSVGLPQPVRGGRTVSVEPGQQERLPVSFTLPKDLPPGRYGLGMACTFDTGEVQNDAFAITIVAPAARAREVVAKVALLDPEGETHELLKRLGTSFERVETGADLGAYDVVIVGKGALGVEGPTLDLSRVRQGGLKVVVFEQKAEVLEKRFGFRIAEYGLRQVYPRVPDHPVLAGFTPEHLRDWRGEATISPPRLKYELSPTFNGAPTVSWCGMPVTRAWRCGNRGNVASVLIEKPVRGDFLPVLDGGFSLQYSPLLEFREGQGLVVFCQLDVTGRTELEPVADLLVRRLLHYVSAWKPTLRKTVVYAGEPQGKTFLESLGMEVAEMGEDTLSPDRVLVLGPEPSGKVGGGAKLGGFLRDGGKILALGLTREEAASLPSPVELEKAEHISTYFEAFPANSPFAGIGPADTHNRDPRELPLVRAGAQAIGNGVLGLGLDQGLVICQLVPWHFDGARQSNLKRTHRRVSFLVSRLLGNLGVEAATPLLARFENPIPSGSAEQRWLEGFYLDKPEEWDDPYRFFRW